jgi:hypothetical protein
MAKNLLDLEGRVLKKWVLGPILGRGEFGVVYQGAGLSSFVWSEEL